MTQLIENQHFAFDHRHGVVTAGRCTLAAAGAQILAPDRSQCLNGRLRIELRLNKQIVVGLFHITVQQPDLFTALGKRISQIDAKRRFTGPALSAGYRNLHVSLLSFLC